MDEIVIAQSEGNVHYLTPLMLDSNKKSLKTHLLGMESKHPILLIQKIERYLVDNYGVGLGELAGYNPLVQEE